MLDYPIFNQEKQGQNSSNPARNRQRETEDVKWKNPEKPQFFKGFIRMFFRFWIMRYGIVGAIPHFLSKE